MGGRRRGLITIGIAGEDRPRRWRAHRNCVNGRAVSPIAYRHLASAAPLPSMERTQETGRRRRRRKFLFAIKDARGDRNLIPLRPPQLPLSLISFNFRSASAALLPIFSLRRGGVGVALFAGGKSRHPPTLEDTHTETHRHRHRHAHRHTDTQHTHRPAILARAFLQD